MMEPTPPQRHRLCKAQIPIPIPGRSSGTSGHGGSQARLALVRDTHPEPVFHDFPELQARGGLVETQRRRDLGKDQEKPREKWRRKMRKTEASLGTGEPRVA